MALTCGVVIAALSTIVMMVVLVRNHKALRHATAQIEFMRMRQSSSYAEDDVSRQVEMTEVNGGKYSKLPLEP